MGEPRNYRDILGGSGGSLLFVRTCVCAVGRGRGGLREGAAAPLPPNGQYRSVLVVLGCTEGWATGPSDENLVEKKEPTT